MEETPSEHTQKRARPPLPYGFVKQSQMAVLEDYVGVRVTQNALWNAMPELDRDTFIDAYGSLDKAKRAWFGNLTGRRGVAVVEVHQNGESIIVYQPTTPEATQAKAIRPFVGKQVTFVMVGWTGDGEALWRNDDTDELGWYDWKSL